MARLMKVTTDTKNDGSKENATVKMARLLNIQTDPENGFSTINKSTLKTLWISNYPVEYSAIMTNEPKPFTLPRTNEKRTTRM